MVQPGAPRVSGNGSGEGVSTRSKLSPRGPLPAAWLEFMWFCFEMGHGEIERLKIQDGLPVLAEMTKKKVKFVP